MHTHARENAMLAIKIIITLLTLALCIMAPNAVVKMVHDGLPLPLVTYIGGIYTLAIFTAIPFTLRVWREKP